jgi:hypothetical protein
LANEENCPAGAGLDRRNDRERFHFGLGAVVLGAGTAMTEHAIIGLLIIAVALYALWRGGDNLPPADP